MPHWSLAILAGTLTVVVFTTILTLGLGIEVELSLLISSGVGLSAGLLVAGRILAAELILAILEAFLSAAAAVLGLIAAVFAAVS